MATCWQGRQIFISVSCFGQHENKQDGYGTNGHEDNEWQHRIYEYTELWCWTLLLDQTILHLYPIIGEKNDDKVAQPRAKVRHLDLISAGNISLASSVIVPYNADVPIRLKIHVATQILVYAAATASNLSKKHINLGPSKTPRTETSVNSPK